MIITIQRAAEEKAQEMGLAACRNSSLWTCTTLPTGVAASTASGTQGSKPQNLTSGCKQRGRELAAVTSGSSIEHHWGFGFLQQQLVDATSVLGALVYQSPDPPHKQGPLSLPRAVGLSPVCHSTEQVAAVQPQLNLPPHSVHRW